MTVHQILIIHQNNELFIDEINHEILELALKLDLLSNKLFLFTDNKEIGKKFIVSLERNRQLNIRTTFLKIKIG